ncbi:EscU/YscU/HrcU family type III secretion system export apparatus switch protein [bacterium]|nr:EscU/YscU/HrcU family type III secretion system export apparatus switch protein [candidate division CSSED10-310 bacterium]
MSERRTEKPTEKKKRDARKRGQVAYSTDTSAAAVFIAGFGILLVNASKFIAIWVAQLEWFWSSERMNGSWDWVHVLGKFAHVIISMSIPIIFSALLFGWTIGYLQVGPLFRTTKVDLSRLMPIQYFQKTFTIRRLQDILKNICKLSLVITTICLLIKNHLPALILVDQSSLESVVGFCKEIIIHAGFILLILGSFYGFVDYLLQRYWWLRELKMTRQEVLREHKDAEGDPTIKERRKQMHREISEMLLFERVSAARVVVVNPTHYAVAIQYEDHWETAPRVVAKGYLKSAEKIRAIASENNVPVLRNPPLARRLYDLSLDQEIPSEFFRAVAELLIYLQSLSYQERMRCR